MGSQNKMLNKMHFAKTKNGSEAYNLLFPPIK